MSHVSSNNWATIKNLPIAFLKWALFFAQTSLHILLWPLIMTFKRCCSEIQFATAYGKEKFEKQMIRRDHMIISSRARIIEVCIESSFQPLLLLYLLLPTLIHYFECGAYHEILTKPLHKTFPKISTLQFWSIFSSVISLSLSFNYYKITQKSGALDIKTNPTGRICLFLSTLLQISCRLLAFVLLAYCFGPGNFWPMILLLQLHIVLMAGLHFITSRQIEQRYAKISWPRLLHHCLLNGIGNIYIHNCITYMDEKSIKERMKKQHKERQGKRRKKTTFWRQVLFNTIFVLENIAVIVLVTIKLPHSVPVSLLYFIAFGHLFGLILNLVYYQFFHLWKDSLRMHVDLPHGWICSSKSKSHIH